MRQSGVAGVAGSDAQACDATIDYFKGIAAELGIPYQTLINMYLRDCAERQKRPSRRWVTSR